MSNQQDSVPFDQALTAMICMQWVEEVAWNETYPGYVPSSDYWARKQSPSRESPKPFEDFWDWVQGSYPAREQILELAGKLNDTWDALCQKHSSIEVTFDYEYVYGMMHEVITWWARLTHKQSLVEVTPEMLMKMAEKQFAYTTEARLAELARQLIACDALENWPIQALTGKTRQAYSALRDECRKQQVRGLEVQEDDDE